MPNERLEKLLEFAAQQPSDLFLKYGLGMEYLGMGDVQKAEAYFREVIAADPQYVAAYYQLGKLCGNSSRDEEATGLYEKGLEAAKARNDQRSVREFRAALDELL